MAEFFLIVSQALEGILDISNQAIGIMIAWTILDIPLLFILTTYDFIKTLLDELEITQPDNSDPNDLTVRRYTDPDYDRDLIEVGQIIDAQVYQLEQRQKRPVSEAQERNIAKKVFKMYNLDNPEE